MSLLKKIILASGVVFIAIQFIQPARNNSGHALPTDFAKIYTIPANVDGILQNACYDCTVTTQATCVFKYLTNSTDNGNTNKEWKKEIESQRLWKQQHPKAKSKLKEIVKQIKDDEMPIASYKAMHKKANLIKEEKALIRTWMNKTVDSLSTVNQMQCVKSNKY